MSEYHTDILIIGGGNAALCAAMSAAEAGAQVMLIEAAPLAYRGGNSRHTRNFRCLHDKPKGVLVEAYGEEEYMQDLLSVTEGKTDLSLARMTIRESESCYDWMQSHGVNFQPSLSGSLSLNRSNAFFLGGGKALLNAYYRRAEKLGIRIFYDAPALHVERQGDKIAYVAAHIDGQETNISAKAVVVAGGGFQADIDRLAAAWGEAARNFLIRGTPYNRGTVLFDLLEQGIRSVGDATQCHAVAIDGRSPQYDGGIVTRLDCIPFSVVVNQTAARFYDEGEDIWPLRYAIWGRLVAAQPEQTAYAIFDAKSLDLFMPSVFPPIKADNIADLARQLQLPEEALCRTIEDFNKACPTTGDFHPTEKDGLATSGLECPKSNWARPINEAPFYGYRLKTGVTFTYLGLAVNERAQVLSDDGKLMENLWAAGETMAGAILGQGYLAGFGMTIGTVFGRLAGQEAARYVA